MVPLDNCVTSCRLTQVGLLIMEIFHNAAFWIVVAAVSIVMGFVYLEVYSRHKSDITEYLAIRDTMGAGVGKIALYITRLILSKEH